MTSEGGSPGTRPRAPSRDEDTNEDAADPTLDAMRTVWLSMREAEPPERGLAALLAAARAQAASPPREALWWRRLVGLRRPPMLALATVVVLIGGAALVARRADQVVMHEATVSSGGAPPNDVSWPSGSPAAATGAGIASEASAPSAAGIQPPSVESSVGPAPGRSIGSTHSAAGSDQKKPRPEAPTLSVDDGLAPRSPTRASVGSRSPKAALPNARSDGGSVTTGAKADVPADRGSVRATPPPPPEPATRGGTRRGLTRGQAGNADDLQRPPATGGDVNAPETITGRSAAPAAPAVEQLREQCESAARRGDCAAVRRIMGRITQIDRDYHARVAKDAAVARCMADPPE